MPNPLKVPDGSRLPYYIEGLGQIQTEIGEMPCGFDAGVLLACRDLGVVFEQGISEVTFTLNHRPHPVTARYTEEGFHRVQNRIQGPSLTIRTVEERLLMADFKEHGTRCRIHPSVGDPIICLFNESQKEEVREKEGRPISSNDSWIVACAVRHSVPFVTHNAKDFENIQGLEIITKTLIR